MRTLLLCIGLLTAARIGDSQERLPPPKPDGIYVSVLPILGKAMIGDNRIDTALMVQGTPMEHYNSIERFEKTVDVDVITLAVLAESHGGEAMVVVLVVKNGRETYREAAQGRQVLFHYSAGAAAHIAIFPRR
ncbi:MAG TPA: hypothetical protein VFT47_19665 [Vicinamibacterales bacterium]|nr:hypothetical protein [Vicinamibacterales bacterium]